MTRRRVRDDSGAVALAVSVCIPAVFLVCAAFAIDVSRWYLERHKVQAAADAAALAAVPYMPYDLASATARAQAVAARNGYDTANPDVEVVVAEGAKPAQVRVEVSSRLDNIFGGLVGASTTVVSQVAVADYQGPAPMGSPCNTFGNEPPAGTGSASADPAGTARGPNPFPNCLSRPQLWATVEGPETGKVQGDRYQTRGCEESGVDGCGGLTNEEYDEFGHVFVVKVEPAAVGQQVELQLYDPMFVNSGQTCGLLPSASTFASSSALVNPYVTSADARNRYSRDGATHADFCTGDSFPGALPSRGTPDRMTTSFVLREQVDSQDPHEAPVQQDTVGAPCIRQYAGWSTSRDRGAFSQVPDSLLRSSRSAYEAEVAQAFHNWVSFCRFVPTRPGDYYLQVRSNVSLGGSGGDYVRVGNAAAAAATGNTRDGAGANSFAVRAVLPPGFERSVAVSGFDHMPIYANAPSATSTFNLLRVLPGAAGRRITFEFFDAADVTGSTGGSVQVQMPTDATYTGAAFPGGCVSRGGAAGSGHISTDCRTSVSNAANNGKVQTMTIPVPDDYSCGVTSLGGCWYRVVISFPGAQVTDTTTWNARVEGDPVRLVE